VTLPVTATATLEKDRFMLLSSVETTGAGK